jgi:predicted CoA-binding protein
VPAYPDLQSLPVPIYGVSFITPSTITEQIIEQAVALGIQHLWMQPGAESTRAIEIAASQQINVIGGTGCVLVALGFQDI